jgi:bacterial/archaeal transporter family-2 protein
MNNTLYVILVAIIGGFAVTLQGQLMGMLGRNVGISASVFTNYFCGAIIASIMIITLQPINIKLLINVPWYLLLVPGILGLIIIGSFSYTVPRLGLAITFTIIVTAQFILTIIIDHFGLFGTSSRPIDINRLVGFSSLIFGVWLITK